jgi:hypothetical protein
VSHALLSLIRTVAPALQNGAGRAVCASFVWILQAAYGMDSMMTFRHVTVGLCCLALVGLLRATAVANPLDVGSTLCLHPVQIPVSETAGKERRANLEKRLADALVAASYQVRDPQAVSDLIKRVQNDVGGFIDVATGRRDVARYRVFSDRLAAALRSELGCDAQLTGYVAIVRAPFQIGTATWDGATDSVSSTGRVVLNLIGGNVESGWVTALSLWICAYDLNGSDLAFRTAGIESLVSLSVVHGQDVLPEDVWLTDAQKLDAAIHSALGPNGTALRLQGTPAGVGTSRNITDVQQDVQSR